jgi:hypothetical protein
MLYARNLQDILILYAYGPYVWTSKTEPYLETVYSVGSPDLNQLQGCWTDWEETRRAYVSVTVEDLWNLM